MKKIFYIVSLWLFCAASVTLLSSCNNDDDDDGKEVIIDDSYKPVKLTPISGTRIMWDYSSLTKLASKGASPEMLRAGNELVAVYDSEGTVYLTTSQDGGASWSVAVNLFPQGTVTGKNGEASFTINEMMETPVITLLPNGDLVAACAVRYKYTLDGTTIEYPVGIKTRRIKNDRTLESIATVYSNLGVQNPSFLQLPNGKLQLYFTNGNNNALAITTLSSTALELDLTGLEVAVIESSDNGQTWSSFIKDFGPDGSNRSWTGAKTVASRSNKHNIWPAPIVLDNEIVVALADNKTMTYKPYVVRCPLAANWTDAVRGDTPDREYALYEILPDKYYMNGTDMLALSSGEVLLSYETDEGRDTNYELMEVAISAEAAYDFKYRTRPFQFATDKKAINNSLMLYDANTIFALTTSNYGLANEKDEAPFYIKGHMIKDLAVSASQITNRPIFVGGKTEANISAGLGIDGSNLYVNIIANDNTPNGATTGLQDGDGVYLYIDAANLSLLDVDAGISKFWISSSGDTKRWDGKEGIWVEASSSGITATTKTTANGYTIDVTVPRSALTNFNSQGIRFGIGLTDYTDKDNGVTELLSLCRDIGSYSWLGITF